LEAKELHLGKVASWPVCASGATPLETLATGQLRRRLLTQATRVTRSFELGLDMALDRVSGGTRIP